MRALNTVSTVFARLAAWEGAIGLLKDMGKDYGRAMGKGSIEEWEALNLPQKAMALRCGR